MFNVGWVTLFSPSVPIEAGRAVAILVRVFGVWWLSAARIVYIVDEEGDVRRFGFAYGTLADHAESGEERFSVEWRRSDDSGWHTTCSRSRGRAIRSREREAAQPRSSAPLRTGFVEGDGARRPPPFPLARLGEPHYYS